MEKCMAMQKEKGGDFDLWRMTRIITRRCDLTFTKRGARVRGKRAVYWWNAEVGQARRNYIKMKRTLTRRNSKKESTAEEREDAQAEYRKARSELKQKILNSKKREWKILIQQLDDDIWGKGYQIVTTKFGLKKKSEMTLEERMKQARILFPAVTEVRWPRRQEDREEPPPLITASELEEAIKRIKHGKAPGPDQIPPEVIKIVLKRYGEDITRMYNNIIHNGTYPDFLKRARLVLAEKPKKDETNMEEIKYRLICLLNVIAKVLETILVARLTKELGERAPLSENQYDFRRGRSAVDAMLRVVEIARRETDKAYQHKGICVLINVDVENAFNTAKWNNIVAELERRKISNYLVNMIKGYLTNRAVVIGGTTQIKTTCGVPQGSVLGPLLWNVQYDGVSGVDVPRGVELVGYADDLAVIVTGKRKEEVERRAEVALEEVTRWMESKDLRVAPHKIEVVVLAGRRKIKEVQIRIKNKNIKSKAAIKYLGVTFGKDLNFSEHVRRTADRASEIAARLARVMPNINGPKASRRKLLYSTMKSVLIYGAPVWRTIMSKAVHREKYNKVHRRMLLGVCAAYRTVSTAVVEVIAGIAPIDLQIEECVETYKKIRRRRKQLQRKK